MSSTLQGVVTAAGRLMLAAIFLLSAVGNKIPHFSAVVQVMRTAGVPQPEFMLAGAIVFLIVGSVTIIVGYKARFGSVLLLAFLVLATYYFHAFWNFEGQEQQMQMIQFLKNASIAGGLLFILANGPGPVSMDRRNAVSRPATLS